MSTCSRCFFCSNDKRTGGGMLLSYRGLRHNSVFELRLEKRSDTEYSTKRQSCYMGQYRGERMHGLSIDDENVGTILQCTKRAGTLGQKLWLRDILWADMRD